MAADEKEKGAIPWRLAQALHEVRTDDVRDPDRQAPPQRDQRPVLRIERVVLRDFRAPVEAVFVGERRGLEAPVLLEIERSGALLAAPEVEYAGALAGSAA